MSVKFPRKKDRHFLLSLLYKLDKLMPFSKEAKLRLYLNLEWIFDRLAHERSFQVLHPHPVRIESFQFLKAHLSPTYRVLDLGCGTGDLSNQIANCVAQVIALDHDPVLLEWARKNRALPNLSFENGDAETYLASKPESVDVLILSHILEHLDNPIEFLIQSTPYCRFIYIEVPDFDRTPLNHYRKQLNVRLQYADNDHIWEFDRKDMLTLIRKANLKLVNSEFRFGVQKYWCQTDLSQ